MGMLLALAYRMVEADRFTRVGHFKQEQTLALMGVGCSGNTVGLTGLGKVARFMVPRIRAFDMHILYTKRIRLGPEKENALGIEWALQAQGLATQGRSLSTPAPLRALRAPTPDPAWSRPVMGEGVTSCPRAGCGKSACPVR
jgi:lactate dehydrogenase-like 2-hydroxyacid dehydrogenase